MAVRQYKAIVIARVAMFEFPAGSPVINSCGATFPADVETFHMLKLDSRTTRFAVSSFLNCAFIDSLSCSVSLRRGGSGCGAKLT